MVHHPPSSWHVPDVPPFRRPNTNECLYVVFLQRLSTEERSSVVEALEQTDEEAVRKLNIIEGRPPQRRILAKPWIRDSVPSSAAVLKIAEKAFFEADDSSTACSSLIFADSGWESGNVIVAHWEQQDEEPRLAACRVPMTIANVLLTACDKFEGTTLSGTLGPKIYEESKVVFYDDLPSQPPVRPTPRYPWPKHLPENLALDKSRPTIVSLRNLDADTIAKFHKDVEGAAEDLPARDVQAYNWEGPEPSNRLQLQHLFLHMWKNTAEEDRNMCAFFIDYLLQGPNGEPQIVAAFDGHGSGTTFVPIRCNEFLAAWKAAADGEDISENEDLVDIWGREFIDDLNTINWGQYLTYTLVLS